MRGIPNRLGMPRIPNHCGRDPYRSGSQTLSACYPIKHATLGVLPLSQNVVY